MVQAMLEVGIIQPSESDFSSLEVMVINKDSSLCMYLNYRQLRKMIIKDKFRIPIIDELLDKLHGEIFSAKLDSILIS